MKTFEVNFSSLNTEAKRSYLEFVGLITDHENTVYTDHELYQIAESENITFSPLATIELEDEIDYRKMTIDNSQSEDYNYRKMIVDNSEIPPKVIS